MRSLLVCLLVPAAVAMAQDNPFSAFNKRAFEQMKMWMLSSAEKMPAGHYDFKPTASVRSFGQIIGHVADTQNMFCSVVLGEKNPAPGIEKTKTTKADLLAALKGAFAYCDKAYDNITDADATQTVKLFGGDVPKPIVLTINDMHDAEHYGNIVTYLRMNNIVPPSSEPRSQPQPKK